MSPTPLLAASDSVRGDLWREVSKDEFYGAIGAKNVHPHIQPGPYPYTSSWESPDRRAFGLSVGYIPEGESLTKQRYYLPTRPANG